ncbi:MAG: hypothetical protein EOP84_31810 [Verrucomicrobiaceae bacterium]|nr:MAG: hypothetical protein EOP84_31810 [Verrucomicrobiaceae bacterium]
MNSPMNLQQEMDYSAIVEALRSLTAWNFDYNNPAMNGPELLEQLTDRLLELPERQLGVPELFNIMERLPEAELGTPGPLVYTLEQLDYIEELIQSVQRVPTVLSVWMISRLLRSKLHADRRPFFLDLLAGVPRHDRATYATREDAKHFLRLYSSKVS